MNIRDYIQILRPGHWFKNVVVFFGAIGAIVFFKISAPFHITIFKTILATLLACLISSVNYTINDITDEKGDAKHPIKKDRLVPSKQVSKKLLFINALFLFSFSIILAFVTFGREVVFMLLSLFAAGIFYNIKPFRLKDLPVLDVVAESINNPIRILIGWFAIATSAPIPPLPFLLLFWTAGAALMSAKRYAELMFFIHNHKKSQLVSYRNSFKTYTPRGVFFMVLTYLTLTMFFFIQFAQQFKQSLLMATLPIAIFFVWFVKILKEDDNFFREPERIFAKKPYFSLSAMIILLLLISLALSS